MDAGSPLLSSAEAPAAAHAAALPRTPPRMRRRRRLLAGVLLLLALLVAQQTQMEVLAAQEREVVGLNVPVESIFMNHAWLVFNFAFAWGQARRRLGFWPSPLCAVRRFLAGAAAAGWSRWRMAGVFTALAWLYLLPNVTWAAGMKQVSVTLSVAIQQCSCVFVYLLSLALACRAADADGKAPHRQQQQEQQQQQKQQCLTRWGPVAAIVACLAGVLCVSLGEAQEGNAGGGSGGQGSLWTWCLLFVFPVVIAWFDVAFSRWSALVCADTESVLVFIGCIGLANLLTCWPALIVCRALGVGEGFVLPSPFSLNGGYLYGNAALATCYNFAFMVGLNLLGPVFISIGSVLQLPVSAVTDLLLHGQAIGALNAVGGVCICAGFVVLVNAEPGAGDEEGSDGSGVGDNGAACGPHVALADDDLGEAAFETSCSSP